MYTKKVLIGLFRCFDADVAYKLQFQHQLLNYDAILASYIIQILAFFAPLQIIGVHKVQKCLVGLIRMNVI